MAAWSVRDNPPGYAGVLREAPCRLKKTTPMGTQPYGWIGGRPVIPSGQKHQEKR
jgi:hypothetical protein